MAQSSMDLFESKRLAAIGMVEQVGRRLPSMTPSLDADCLFSTAELRDQRDARGQDAKEPRRGHDPALRRERGHCNVRPLGAASARLLQLTVNLSFPRPHSRLDKVRIIALYIMYKDGVPDEDRRRLFQHAKLNIAEQDAINNLVLLGQKVVKVRLNPPSHWS